MEGEKQMTKSLDARLYKVARQLKTLEERKGQMEEDIRLYSEEQLMNQFTKLQKRYMKHNGFSWNPAMYEGNRLREVRQ
jgi:hypothetical protein